jgi:hypothetical protein
MKRYGAAQYGVVRHGRCPNPAAPPPSMGCGGCGTAAVCPLPHLRRSERYSALALCATAGAISILSPAFEPSPRRWVRISALIGLGSSYRGTPRRVARQRSVLLGPRCTKGTHTMSAPASFSFEVVFRSSRRRAGESSPARPNFWCVFGSVAHAVAAALERVSVIGHAE